MNRTHLFLIVFTLFLPGALIAQRGQNWCGQDVKQNQIFDTHPGSREQWDADEAMIRSQMAATAGLRDENEERVVVPTVVHILHDGGVGNITAAQVESAIRVLNEDFQHRGPDTNDTREIFKPVAGCANFEFRLARLDPNGNVTNGIIRTDVGAASYDADDNVKSQSWWPGVDYFNIWVVNTIESSGVNGIILGYAYFPGTANWNAEYGVIIRHDQFGDEGTASGGRTLTHEVGHSFALRHTFQGSCGGACNSTGDQICDTPPVFEDTQSCNVSQNTCSNDNSGPNPFGADVVDQIENYMSYDDCQNMFSALQVARMRTTATTNSTLSGLISPANLAQTGVDQLYAVNFGARSRIACVGQTVPFLDQSTYGQNDWSWQFTGGAPASSDEQYPSVVYNSAGLYNVSLTAGNGTTSLTKSKSGFVLVVPQVGRHSPHTENFEGITFPNEDWIFFNPDDGLNKWKLTTAAAVSGTHSLKMHNYGNVDGALETLTSSSFDLSNLENATVTFKLAYAQRNANTDDKIRYYVSTDCGESWLIRWAGSGASLATAPETATEFIPTANDWEEITVNLTSSNLVENFQMRFEFESNQGNHLYLDDINISGDFNPIPVLQWPLDGQTGLADQLSVDWKSVGFIDSYEMQLDITTAFSSSELVTASKTYISTSPNNTDTEEEVLDLTHGQEYFWRVRSVTGGVPSQWSDVWSFTVSADGVGFDEIAAEATELHVWPNPVTDRASVSFTLTESSPVSLKIYDAMGRLVSVVDEGIRSQGTHTYSVGKNSLKSGMYLVHLQINNDISCSKILVK